MSINLERVIDSYKKMIKDIEKSMDNIYNILRYYDINEFARNLEEKVNRLSDISPEIIRLDEYKEEYRKNSVNEVLNLPEGTTNIYLYVGPCTTCSDIDKQHNMVYVEIEGVKDISFIFLISNAGVVWIYFPNDKFKSPIEEKVEGLIFHEIIHYLIDTNMIGIYYLLKNRELTRVISNLFHMLEESVYRKMGWDIREYENISVKFVTEFLSIVLARNIDREDLIEKLYNARKEELYFIRYHSRYPAVFMNFLGLASVYSGDSSLKIIKALEKLTSRYTNIPSFSSLFYSRLIDLQGHLMAHVIYRSRNAFDIFQSS